MEIAEGKENKAKVKAVIQNNGKVIYTFISPLNGGRLGLLRSSFKSDKVIHGRQHFDTAFDGTEHD